MSKGSTEILARTIFGEARGEYKDFEGGLASLIAVGNVVMNRAGLKGTYGQSIEEICLKPRQFSCWNTGDPNRALLMQDIIADPIFALCRLVAAKVVSGEWPDLTKGSDHYHAITLPAVPTWARNQKPKARFGQHLFYQLTTKKEGE
jgi:spore germination cell wall hydrolase CwlJ-like protein